MICRLGLVVVACAVAFGCRAEDPPASGVKLGEIGEPAPDRGAVADPPKPEAKAPAEDDAPPVIDLQKLSGLDEAKVQTACVEMMMLHGGVEMYMVSQRGSCPPDLEALKAEGFIADLRADPWGHPYALTCPDPKITSGGRDGEAGTEDDLAVGDGLPKCGGK